MCVCSAKVEHTADVINTSEFSFPLLDIVSKSNKKRAAINLSTYNCPDAVLGLIELLLEYHKPYFTKLPCHQQISIEIMAFVYILLFLVIYHLVVYLLMIYLKYQLFLVSYSLSLSNQAMDYHLRFAESQ